MKVGIYDFLFGYALKDTVSFHMPGHKGNKQLYRQLGYGALPDEFLKWDVTELHGADNLFQAEGIIKEAQDAYAAFYGVEKSYLLVNGSSGGILASVLASVPKGKKLIMARNCHKSVFNALTLGGIEPIYIYPELLPDYGIAGPVSPAVIEEILLAEPEAEAVILASPNYYGICSDIKAIARVAHRHKKILIVDEAHGAHLKMMGGKGQKKLPLSAVDQGADLVINSMHKTMAALTQSAVLHLNSRRVDPRILEDKLQIVQTSSPSYLLMTSLAIACDMMERYGEELSASWLSDLEWFYEEAKKISGLSVMKKAPRLDYTKINLSMKELGISGKDLEDFLREECGIYMELVTGDMVMAMTGIGNRRKDYERLLEGLTKLAENNRDGRPRVEKNIGETPAPGTMNPVPQDRELIFLAQAEGRVSASMLIPYPPGIPLICPGETITMEAIAYIGDLRKHGEKVIGVGERGEVLVGRED